MMTEDLLAPCSTPPAAGLFGAGCPGTRPAPAEAPRHAPSPSQRKGFQELFRDEGGTLHVD